MPFNTEMCEVIVFSKVPKAYPVFDPGYALGGTPLKCRQEIKYLGIILQSNLKFEKHIVMDFILCNVCVYRNGKLYSVSV